MKRLINDLFAYSHMATREELVEMAAILDKLIAEFSAVMKNTGREYFSQYDMICQITVQNIIIER